MTQPDAAPEPLPGCILLVEDDPLVRFPIAEALRDLGISVVEAATADEAWDHLRIAASTVDLVFTDYHMPGSMTGEELASRISEEYPDIATVITSGGSGALDTARFLEKPYDLFKTANALSELALKHRSWKAVPSVRFAGCPSRGGRYSRPPPAS
jgi:CheY-like chemotaxis protein